MQLHSAHYRNADQLPKGAVLVVGSCQIVENLRLADREVYLCVGKAARIPRRYLGREIIQWLFDAGFQDVPVDKHPLSRAIRFESYEHLKGRDGGRAFDLRQLALGGTILLGRMNDAYGFEAYFSSDLNKTLDKIDEACQETLAQIDQYIDEKEVDAAPNDLEPISRNPLSIIEKLDLKKAGIGSIV